MLAPLFLFGAAAVSLPIILHLLRKEPTEIVTFPTLKFLQKSMQKSARTSSIRRWLVLLARCFVFGLLALAFARPFFAYPFSGDATGIVIVLDNSYSMGAGGQFEKARQAAMSDVRQLTPKDLVGLVIANSHPRLAVPLGHDSDAVLRELRNASLSYEANDYEASLRTADSQLATAPCGTKIIDWYGDDQFLAWQGVDFQRPLTLGVGLNVVPCAERKISDVGIDEVQVPGVLSTENQPLVAQVKVHNWSTIPEKRVVHVELDGKEVASSSVNLAPGQITQEKIAFTTGAGPLHAIKGDVKLDADDFPYNDVRYFALNPQKPLHVGVWPPGPDSEPDLVAVALAPSLTISTIQPILLGGEDDVKKCDLFVLRPGSNGDSKITQAIVAAIQNGKSALVFTDADRSSQSFLHGWGVDRDTRPVSDDPVHMGAIDFTRPEVQLFAKPGNGDLFQIRFTNPPVLQFQNSAQIIASFEDGTPAIAKIGVGKSQVVIVATALDRASTTWPFHSTFLPFVQETLRHLVPKQNQLNEILVGDPVPGDQSADQPLKMADKPGVVETKVEGRTWLIAVNVDPSESDLTPWTNKTQMAQLIAKKSDLNASVATVSPAQQEEVEQHQRLWWYALLTGLILLFLEMILANLTPL